MHKENIHKSDTPRSITFENRDPFQQPFFKNRVEAKTAISEHIGRPLGRLNLEQLHEIDSILNETLDKKSVLAQVRTYFTLSAKNRKGEGSFSDYPASQYSRPTAAVVLLMLPTKEALYARYSVVLNIPTRSQAHELQLLSFPG